MDQAQKKREHAEKLIEFQKSLNVKQLYEQPDHKDTMTWLAGVAVALKNLDEGDYNAFMNHRQHLFPSTVRSTRKHAAEQINAFIREKAEAYRVYDFTPLQASTPPYVTQAIVDGFVGKKDKFNYKKLVNLLTGLNGHFTKNDQYSSAMSIRAVLDHIPPLLGFLTFDEVVSSYPWSKTDREFMKALLSFKNDAHDVLHRTISEDEDLFEIYNLPGSNRFNRLLQECLKKGGDLEFTNAKEKERESKKSKPASKINISLVESGTQSWQNYSISHYMSYSYKFVLDIDNFKSSKLDYVTVLLKAKLNDGDEWEGRHFVFEMVNASADTPYRIEASEQKTVTVGISDEQFDRGSRDHRFRPSIDEKTMVLYAKTKSGETFELPIIVINP